MNRSFFRRVLALVLALSFVGAACSGSPTDAARVNGTAIPQGDISDEIKALVAAVQGAPDDKIPPEQRAQLLSQLTTGNAGQGSPTSSASASLLTNRIFGLLVSDALTKFGLSVEAQDVDASSQDVDASSIYGLASDKWRQAAIDEGARTSRLSRYLEDTTNVWYTDADVDAYYAAKKSTFVQACTSHILVDDKAVADKLLAELKAGADFAQVAAANSTDTSNKDDGGDLGCNAEGAFVPPFEAAVKTAKAGDLVGPVQTDFGFHLIKVTTPFTPRELDDALRAEIKTTLATPVGWLDLTLTRAKITVNSKYGTWDAAQRAVVPPSGATPAAGNGTTGQ